MNESWYDTAQICTNGHVINWMSVSRPDYNRGFCGKCGASTVTNCQYCNAKIMGYYHVGRFTIEEHKKRMREILHPLPNATLDYNTGLTLPSFCSGCGKPYPWTETKLKAAQELSDEIENLSPEEREMLKKSLDDIVRDTPQTTVAATRFKKLVTKAGPVVADGFRKILVDVLSETAKKIIWPS
ncbi:MAG: DUF2321 domain-containing protein [Dehalococcoidales bacterium]|nr:DUF2321 domain-containing protein [Dehalococcoidales bacterium]